MKSLLFALFLGISIIPNAFAAQPLLGTNAPIGTIFYELFETHTNARPWYVVKPKEGPPGHSVTVIEPPLDRINELGTHADFTVIATNQGPPIQYQWYKLSGITNRVAIPGATENVLCIEGVQSSDVAGYEVVLSQAGEEKTNLLANLSVMTLACTASVQGQIESPITAFTPYSGASCDGKIFAKCYSPYSNGKLVLLYGPSVPPIYQIGDGINSTKMPRLTVSTHNPTNDFANAPADTGIKLQNSAHTLGLTSQVYEQCNDNVRSSGWPGDPNAARLSISPMSTSDNRYVSTYRVTIYYSGNPPPSGKIYWNWLYHQ